MNSSTQSKVPILLAILFFSTFGSCQKERACTDMKLMVPKSPTCSVGMDVSFLIDYTGSMAGAIEKIKYSISLIVAKIADKSKGDYRLSLGIFDEVCKNITLPYLQQQGYNGIDSSCKKIYTIGPSSDQYLTMMQTFSLRNKQSFMANLNLLNSSDMQLGDGCKNPEPGGLLAYEVIENNFAGSWRSKAKKLCFIITDAPDGGVNDVEDAAENQLLSHLATRANAKGIQCILITTMPDGSNYEMHLINNNKGSYKLTNVDFDHVATHINTVLDAMCE